MKPYLIAAFLLSAAVPAFAQQLPEPQLTVDPKVTALRTAALSDDYA